MSKVSFEKATEEVEKWLDSKRIPAKKLEGLSSMKDNLVDQVMDGNLLVNEDLTLTQILVFADGMAVDSLSYKNRITSKDLEPHKRIVKGDTFEDNLTRVIMACTGQPVNVLRNLDTSTDRALAESIAVFFM